MASTVDDIDDMVSTLQAVVGVSREAAAAMLSRAGGDVAVAVNRHFAAHDVKDQSSRHVAVPEARAAYAGSWSVGEHDGRPPLALVKEKKKRGGGVRTPEGKEGMDGGGGAKLARHDHQTHGVRAKSPIGGKAKAPRRGSRGTPRDEDERAQRSLMRAFVLGGVGRTDGGDACASAPSIDDATRAAEVSSVDERAPEENTVKAEATSTSTPSTHHHQPGGPTLALHPSIRDPRAPRNGEGDGRSTPAANPAASLAGAAWPVDGAGDVRAPYLALAETFEALTNTTKRLNKGDALKRMFLKILSRAPDDLLPAVYLTFGRCADRHEGVELSVGGATISAAVREVTGASRARVSRMYDELGDLGDVAAALKRSQVTLRPPPPLTAAGVFATLRRIAAEVGAGSAARKKGLVLGLLRAARGCEVRYLVRTLIRNMRIGANRISVLHALAAAAEAHHRGSTNEGESAAARYTAKAEAKAKAREGSRASVPTGTVRGVTPAMAAVQRAYSLCPSLDVLVPALVAGGVDLAVRRAVLRPGMPVKPMLATITVGVADAVAKIRGGGHETACDGGCHAGVKTGGAAAGTSMTISAPSSSHSHGSASSFLAEFKYDGVRGQIHLVPPSQGEAVGARREWSVKIFSRNCEDRTQAFPDVIAAMMEAAAGGVGMERQRGPRSGLGVCGARGVRGDDGSVGDRSWGGGGLVVDAEIVGIDRSTGKLKAFQDLSSRARGAVTEAEVAVDVCVMIFDLLHVGDLDDDSTGDVGEAGERGDGTCTRACGGKENAVAAVQSPSQGPSDERDLVRVHDMSLRERRAMLKAALPGLGRMPGRVEMAQSIEVGVRGDVAGGGVGLHVEEEPRKEEEAVGDMIPPAAAQKASLAAAVESVESFMHEALDAACEGLMLKRLDGPMSAYSPSKRADSWLKVKKDYCEELRDSLDLVCIGAWRGNGRKAGWYSPFLLAIYDPEREEYSSMCRCMSGFTDAFYADRTARFSLPDVLIPSKPPYYNTLEVPDVWFAPTEVWEVRGADLTLSPKHRAAAGMRHADRGISLRFPRFISHRTDKGVEDASGPDQVTALYDAQQRRFDGQSEAAARRLRDAAAVAAKDAADDTSEEEDSDKDDQEKGGGIDDDVKDDGSGE